MRGWTLGRGWRGGERGERWTTALESDGGGGEDGEARAGCQVDRTRCYRRRRNRLTSQRCHLRDVSSYLFRLSLSIWNGRRVTEEEAMRAVRELDREQLDLVSGERRRGRKEVDRMKRSMSSWSTLFTQAKVTSWYQLFLPWAPLLKFWSFTSRTRSPMLKDHFGLHPRKIYPIWRLIILKHFPLRRVLG